MPRKGWANLSDKYRDRLTRKGITEASYDAGVSLHVARGKVSRVHESHKKRTLTFAREQAQWGMQRQSEILRDVRSMSRVQGEAYMREVRKMSKLYARGDIEEAHRM